MLRIGNALLACLLLAVAFSGHAVAARANDRDVNIVLPPGSPPDSGHGGQPKDLGEKVFTLRHIYHHGTHDYPNLHRYVDIPKDAQLYIKADDGETRLPTEKKLRARGMSTNVERMVDRSRGTVEGLLEYAGAYGHAMSLPSSAWTVDEISGPNYTDKSSVITFAKMANNAYTEEPNTGGWEDVKGGFNYTDDFGWEQDGLRGHIFADETNKTIVIGLKGTSMAVFDGAETTGNDKLNDNLFGSCCCAQGGHWTWKQVCDCKGDGFTCNSTCVRQALNKKSHYYWAAKDLYHNVTERYPTADVWFSGHSLGGVVGTLIGLTFGLPVITFEAYPDALAASRLGLPTPPGYRIGAHQARPDTATHHFGHTADPVYMGNCGSAGSLCTIGGYAFESYCHTGMTCTYDTVKDFGWRSSVMNHKITSVIHDVLEKYDTVANCTSNPDCQDCYAWNFFESNGTETTTSAMSTSTSRTRTRTETCLTPGWFGCLDETTTTTMSTTSTSSSSSSSTTPDNHHNHQHRDLHKRFPRAYNHDYLQPANLDVNIQLQNSWLLRLQRSYFHHTYALLYGSILSTRINFALVYIKSVVRADLPRPFAHRQDDSQSDSTSDYETEMRREELAWMVQLVGRWSRRMEERSLSDLLSGVKGELGYKRWFRMSSMIFHEPLHVCIPYRHPGAFTA
ncbi:putative lipase atg15 [Saxophila tyrrhenica]|uniref:triacylglycerol lipase n=1 Tax=Saxophila tyrrhenica TaxID=1690608 RepID=A0AAV9PBD6_9PEZI|nr:putative lipase atg15 [Saxophila tyrrhenica]